MNSVADGGAGPDPSCDVEARAVTGAGRPTDSAARCS